VRVIEQPGSSGRMKDRLSKQGKSSFTTAHVLILVVKSISQRGMQRSQARQAQTNLVEPLSLSEYHIYDSFGRVGWKEAEGEPALR